MRIAPLAAVPPEAVEDFLRSRPEALLYHSTRYRRFLADLLGCVEETLVAVEGARVAGLLPLMALERGGSRVLNSLPYFGSNGGVLGDGPARAALVEAYNTRVRGAGVLSGTVVSNPFDDAAPGGIAHTLTDERIAQWTELPGPGGWEGFLASLDSSARRNVRKASEAGVTHAVDAGALPELARLHRANMAEIGGTAKTDRFFDLIARHFREGEDWALHVARHEGRVVAALLLFYCNGTVEYFTPASETALRALQPLPLAILRAMEDAVRRGMRRWNWGGTWTSQEGVYRFKRKWGARERRYTYYVHVNDASVLDWPRERLLSTFPGFYVVPFSTLRNQGASG